MKETFWVLRKIFRNCSRYIIGYVFIALLSTAITVGVNLLNRSLLNRLVQDTAGGSLSGASLGLAVSYIAAWLCSTFIGFFLAFGNNLFRLKVDVFLQKLFMYKSIRTDQDRFFDSRFMDSYTFISSNAYRGSYFMLRLMDVLFQNTAVVVSALALYAFYAPFLLAYTFLAAAIYGFSVFSISRKQYELGRQQINTERRMGYFKNLFKEKNTAKEMRIFGTGAHFFRIWEGANAAYRKERLDMDNKGADYRNIAALVDYGLYAGMVFTLLYSVKAGGCDVGTFVMLMGMVSQCNRSIKSIVGMAMQGLAEDVRYFQEYYSFVAPMTNEEIRRCVRGEGTARQSDEPFRGLEVRDVSYTYPNGGKKAVDGVSLKVEKGEVVSILGYNGSGKTTLVKMIYRALSPGFGEIAMNNRDYRAWSPEDIYRFFGIAPQEFSCYALSLRRNVGLGRVECMEEEERLERAYGDAGLQPLIRKLPFGEETILGKEYDAEGILLSGGEQQKVVLASAYMGEPEVLVLDEPTASIDPFQEMEMLRNFRETLKGRTGILVSHRIGFARLADRIVMMRGGKIVEQGSHEELLEKKGYYWEMYSSQKELYGEG